MKRLLIFSKIFGVIAIMYTIAACSTTGSTTSTASKETMLTQAGFWSKTVTTPKQQQRLAQLSPNVVSAVKYQGKLYYVYPKATKDHILVGKQPQYDAYKQALAAQITKQAPKPADQRTPQEQQMLDGSPVWSGETAGPRHITVTTYDGFGPLDPMQGD
jgi:hypothetical protein